MAIPTYEEFMYPFLQLLKDKKEHSLDELNKQLATYFSLTEEDLEELLPSGKQKVFTNRFGWARTYLKNAKLIDSPRKKIFIITERGYQLISNPAISKIDDTLLKQFPEYIAFKKGNSDNVTTATSSTDVINSAVEQHKTPLELIEDNHQLLKIAIQEELLEKILTNSPKFFEQLIVDLIVAMGYGGSISEAGKAVGKSGDGGIDGIVKEDVLGLDKIYLQGKRWSNPVSRPDIQAFVGSLVGFKANKGIFITTSRFTQEAINYAESIDKSLILIDGKKLTDLMFEYNVGVSNEYTFVIKRLDLDYFDEV